MRESEIVFTEKEFKVSWPRPSRPGEKRYKTYTDVRYLAERIKKLRGQGWDEKDITVEQRFVTYGEWSSFSGH